MCLRSWVGKACRSISTPSTSRSRTVLRIVLSLRSTQDCSRRKPPTLALPSLLYIFYCLALCRSLYGHSNPASTVIYKPGRLPSSCQPTRAAPPICLQTRIEVPLAVEYIFLSVLCLVPRHQTVRLSCLPQCPPGNARREDGSYISWYTILCPTLEVSVTTS